MKLIFFGSSEFSIHVLNVLINSKHTVDLIVTTPAKKKGRGQRESETSVAIWAKQKGIACTAPERLGDSVFLNNLKHHSPDCFMVASYGKMLPNLVLEIPRLLPLNIHPSLLPKYRGAAPIVQQLLGGEKESGVTIAKITEKLDAGEVIAQKYMLINENDNALTLEKKLAEAGGNLALHVLDQLEHGSWTLRAQDESHSTYAKKLSKGEGEIDWMQSAIQVHNKIRAFVSWPSAFTFFNKKRIKILESEKTEIQNTQKEPGTLLRFEADESALVQTGSGILKIRLLQPESGKPMSPHAFSVGHGIKEGMKFE